MHDGALPRVYSDWWLSSTRMIVQVDAKRETSKRFSQEGVVRSSWELMLTWEPFAIRPNVLEWDSRRREDAVGILGCDFDDIADRLA